MITTVDKVKTIMGLTDTSKDGLIEMYIPVVEQDYLNIRNAPFDVDSYGDIVYPIGSDVIASEMVKTRLRMQSKADTRDISSESIDSYSVSYESSSSFYPKSIISSIKRYIRGI